MRWPGGHQPAMYGWVDSVTWIRVHPATSASAPASCTCNSFIASKSKARLPLLPLTSSRIAFLRPVANRVASNTPIAPCDSRAVKTAVSSTVTSPVPDPPVAASPGGRAGGEGAGGGGGRGPPPVVEADHRPHAAGGGRLRGAGHVLGLGDRVGERLLAQHVLAGLERGDRDLGVA